MIANQIIVNSEYISNLILSLTSGILSRLNFYPQVKTVVEKIDITSEVLENENMKLHVDEYQGQKLFFV